MADVLVWLDMEMSGLDPDAERILEVAVLVTNGELDVIAEGPELVVHQDDAVLDAMDAWNTQHHGDSGLTERVRTSKVSVADAEAEVLAFLKEHTAPREAPLCGNSIHQDRMFLRRYMPEVDAYLHYRHVDVSTVKELGRRWYPARYGKRPAKKSQHRAMDDVRESIEELRYYREAFFAARSDA